MQCERCSTLLSEPRYSEGERTPLLMKTLQPVEETSSSQMLHPPTLNAKMGEDEQRLVEIKVTLEVDKGDLGALDLAALLRTWPRTAPGPPVASKIWRAFLRSLEWGKKVCSALRVGILKGAKATHKDPLDALQRSWPTRPSAGTPDEEEAEEEYGAVCTCADGGAWRLDQESAGLTLEA